MAEPEGGAEQCSKFSVSPVGALLIGLLLGGGLLLVFNAFWLKQVRSDIETMKGELEVNRKARLALEKEIHDLRKK